MGVSSGVGEPLRPFVKLADSGHGSTGRTRRSGDDGDVHGHRGLDRVRGSARRPALAGDRNAHHDVIRRGLSRFSGTEVDTSGDGFFATFERPNDALSCACLISDEVRAVGIDIRIGLHADGVERKISSSSSKRSRAVFPHSPPLGRSYITGTMKRS